VIQFGENLSGSLGPVTDKLTIMTKPMRERGEFPNFSPETHIQNVCTEIPSVSARVHRLTSALVSI
jgi:hypothetical protein